MKANAVTIGFGGGVRCNGPTIGIIASLSYFCSVRCCTTRNKKYFQKFLRFLSLVNWFIFLLSLVLLVLSCERMAIELFVGVKVTEWVFGLIMLVSWLVMMIESYISRERWYIKHLGNKTAVMQRIETLKNTQPKIIWSVVGYNYEKREGPIDKVKLRWSIPEVKFKDYQVK